MNKVTIRVVSAEYVRDYQLKVRFSDHIEKVIDFSRWLHGEVFRPLANKRRFKRFLSEAEPCAGRTAPTSLQKPFGQRKTPEPPMRPPHRRQPDHDRHADLLMNRRKSPESLATLLGIPGSRGREAVLKAQLIAAVARKIELRGLTHAELATRSGLPRSAVTGILSGSGQKVTIDRVLRLVESAGLVAISR